MTDAINQHKAMAMGRLINGQSLQGTKGGAGAPVSKTGKSQKKNSFTGKKSK